jgi:hypothetical protein
MLRPLEPAVAEPGRKVTGDPRSGAPINWPQGRFAFTVFDDTDLSTIENTKPVYDFLAELGFRTTKSCWVREPRPGERGKHPGRTATDPQYRQWLLELQSQGFEIGLHNASWASSTREETAQAFQQFEEWFGVPCKTLVNHVGVKESIYWGDARVSGLRRLVYNVLTRFSSRRRFCGHLEGTPGFWGDICRERVTYVRNFIFRELNALKVCPFTPYHDPDRPFVRYWFASADGHDAPTFVRAISEANQDRLEREGGACIMYTHFAKGFCNAGRLDPEFARLMRRLAEKEAWFVPTGVLLDYLGERRGFATITPQQRRSLEWRWLRDKVRVGRS